MLVGQCLAVAYLSMGRACMLEQRAVKPNYLQDGDDTKDSCALGIAVAHFT